ncbi:hypothetical protein LTR85_008972 [Meristemomyces frigidus]|nr:hypothetical protein LTR85_008972 [Meristemomyces frigidus]
MEARQQQPRIMVSPSAQGGVSQHQHPRRPPAHRSVSLLHSARQRLPPSEHSDSSGNTGLRRRSSCPQAEPADSPSHPQPLGRNSSGNSSNAENWFEHSNNDVQTNSVSYMDDEPPFFMRNNSSSSDKTPHGQARLGRDFGNMSSNNSLQVRAELLGLGADGDSAEDYRGVIDDLTVENKKLKRRLKKYERLHDGHLKDEKLFEVRIHGLPAEKKRELEETLQKFASNLGKERAADFPANGYEGLPRLLSKQSTAKTADSAYASMSASAQGGSTAQSGSDSMRKDITPSLASRQHKIHSFLHQIPEGLMPQPSMATMPERAKKRLVVQRLEQLFAGKGAGAVGLQHSQQQQEVSQTAARADRSATEARGRSAGQEGLREACIMHEDAEDAGEGSPTVATSTLETHPMVEERDFARQVRTVSASEQRPTRPLDLDPDRAQVPADNVRYMRHLGFSPRDPRSPISPEDGHGWVYLNLLIGMAQLHTVNVTTDFVTKALSDYSDKFELSQDGRKVRWKGGCRLSRTSSSGGSSVDQTEENGDDAQSPRKRVKLSHGMDSRSNAQIPGGATQRSQAESKKFLYTPMFSHKERTEDADGSSLSEDSTMSSPFTGAGDSDVAGQSCSGARAAVTKKRQHDDGPIIFYNNARFCTDLSGERKPHGNFSAPQYSKISAQPIGASQVAVSSVSEMRGPLATASDLPEPMDLGDNPIPNSMELAFTQDSPGVDGSNTERKPVDFEVTGIGGVWPTDNFAIDVETRHVCVDGPASTSVASVPFSRSLPPKLAQTLNGRDARRESQVHICEQTIASRWTELLPSALPPALGYMDIDEDSTSEDDSSDGEGDISPSSNSHGAYPPVTAPQPVQMNFAESDEDGGGDDDDDSDVSSDASLDLLAAAREIDPEAIRAREREYDANMADRLAEEIQAGSSAATAGGGSGFASPASGVGSTEYQRAINSARAVRLSGIRRASSGDSLIVHGLESSSSSVADSQNAEMSVMDPQITGMNPQMNTSPYPEQMNNIPPQSDVDEFLRKKRKAREHKACYPCRQRKVKCDLSRPCQTCRDRDHPELCSYHPPNKRHNADNGQPILKIEEGTAGPSFVTLGRGEFELLCSKLNGLENSIADLRRELSRNSTERTIHHNEREVSSGTPILGGAPPIGSEGRPRRPTHTDVHGIHTRNDAGEIVHFGGGSIPAMLYALGQGQGQNQAEKLQLQELMGKSVLPLFGLDNESATYPFVDLWGLPHGSSQRALELAKALPNDAQMLQLFRCYREMGFVIYPGITDPAQFEQELLSFLASRAAAGDSVDGVNEQSVYGREYRWIAMLFAVLGSGAQCSAMPRKERELTSQVYICCSFECLRITNFLSQPHLESIQALLIISHVMTNNMNAGTAWSMLGLTIRLAQGLGIHRSCPPNVPHEHVIPRSKVWWGVVWQDSLLSITYDRAGSTAGFDINTMPMPQHFGEIGPYHSIMYRLSKVSLDIVRNRATVMSSREHYAQIVEIRDAISNIMRDSAEYLRDSRKCTSTRETLEHWALYLHTSYALSELFRPSISPSTSDYEIFKGFKQSCIDNLINTVEAYLGLNNITSFARQSWAAMHRALSSALLLGILGEHMRNDRARRLISRFIAVMGDITHSIDPQEISAPIQRGINALRKLKIMEPYPPYFGDERNILASASDGAEETGAFKLDHSSIITPADSDGASAEGDEHSPYSVLNSILWGTTDSYV